MNSEPTIADAFDAVKQEYASFTSDDPVGRQQLTQMQFTLQDEFDSYPRVLTDQAAACIDRFVAAELDFQTPGMRGIGRIGSHIPRFAAKHRRVFSRMSSSHLTKLRHLTKRHIVCGYLFLEFIHPLVSQETERYDSETLFNNWISLVYCPPSSISPENQNVADIEGVWIGATGRAIRDHALEIGIKWDSRDDTGTDQTIVAKYFDAGTTLRYAEAALTV